MAQLLVEACDLCGGQHLERQLATYVVASGNRKAKVILCGIHARPLEQLLPKTAKPPAKRRDPYANAPPRKE